MKLIQNTPKSTGFIGRFGFNNGRGIMVVVGNASRNLVVLDCETSKSSEYHLEQFRHRNLAPWIVASARGFHFWWLSREGEIENVNKQRFPGHDAELRGNNCYVLAPPSVHPTGAIYEWHSRPDELPPSISVAQLDWLPVKLQQRRKTR